MNRADLVAAAAALTQRSTATQGIPARLDNPVMLRRLAALFAAPPAQPDKSNGHRHEQPAAVMSEAHTQHATPTQ